MGDMLSQAEIDALLNGGPLFNPDETEDGIELLPQEVDALGEIGNISMGTCATTLFNLLGQKVVITTPRVKVTRWDDLLKEFSTPFVAVRVHYTDGLEGTNLLIIKEEDVKIITDLMMGGDGSNTASQLTDLHLSAISEAMNQMVGSSATSMSSMFKKRIGISPPKAFMMQLDSYDQPEGFSHDEKLVKIAFRMVIGELIDSEIMQLLPIKFAKDLVDNLLKTESIEVYAESIEPAVPAQTIQQQIPQPPPRQAPPQMPQMPQYQQQMPQNQQPAGTYQMNIPPRRSAQQLPKAPVNVQPIQFQTFDDTRYAAERENIGLIMDVPLQITVELGRTHKMIRDILEFGQGSIIELDKLAGDPVDILVNGKIIAKGEVVVIDESFGVRITDILHPSKRI